jgi:hypothetical protein
VVSIDLDAPAAGAARPRSRRSRWLVAGVTLLVAAAVLVAVRVGESPPPSHTFSGQLKWIADLVDASPRGGVAADRDFSRALGDRVAELSRTSRSQVFGNPAVQSDGDRSARVLFAEDIDDQRIALLALQRPNIRDDQRRYALTDLLWLIAARGAPAEALAAAVAATEPAPGTEYRLDPVAPFVAGGFGEAGDPVWVALAPPECQVATAPAVDPDNWRPDPAGSYLVRRARAGPEYWRVTCDGTVRVERPGPRAGVTDDELDQVLAAAVGDPDREQLGYQLSALYESYGASVLTPPRVLWSGAVALSPTASGASEIFTNFISEDGASDATITVLSAPRARGGWIVSVWTTILNGPDSAFGIDGPAFTSAVDPGAPDTLFAVRLPRWRMQVLTLAPAGAATVRIRNLDGTLLDAATVTDIPVLLDPGPDDPTDALRVEALDATGSVLASTELAADDGGPETISAWD